MRTAAEGFQWILTMLNTIHSVFETLGGIHEKLPEGIKKKIPEFFGQVDEKTLEEELLTRDIKNFLRTLGGQLGEKFNTFLSKLKEDSDRGEDRLTAFRVFLASGIKKGARQVKEFVPLPKGVQGKPTEVSYSKLDLDWAEGFIEEIIALSTYDAQKKYVDLDGGFATMKKVDAQHPIVKKAKEFAKKIVVNAVKTQAGEINASLRENATNLKTSSETARAKAKAFYEASKKKGS